tara:strand:- start:941 stop:1219 length:279 start_codon:yes stop_codon:yes gene_type:complete
MRIFWLFIFLINLSCSNINNKKDVKEIKKVESKTFKCESLNDCTDILYNRMIKLQYEIISIKRLERRKFLVKVDNSPYGLKSLEIDLDECCR